MEVPDHCYPTHCYPVKKLFFVSLANVLQSKTVSKDNNFVRKACADLLNIKRISNSSLFQTKIGKEDILQLLACCLNLFHTAVAY